jgi:hypothetical protein
VLAFQGLASIIMPIISGAFDGVKTIIETATGLISGVIQTFTDLLSGNWGRVWDGIKQTVDTIWGGIEGVISTSVDKLKGIIGGFVGTAIDGLNTLIDIWNIVPGSPHIDRLSKSNILPGFAEGGIVTGPTIGLIGEAGPEAIIPLKNLKQSSEVNVHVYLDGKELTDNVGRRLVREIRSSRC